MQNCGADATTVHEWPMIKGLVMKYLEQGDAIYHDGSITDEERAARLNHLTDTFGM